MPTFTAAQDKDHDFLAQCIHAVMRENFFGRVMRTHPARALTL
jgi:hypothetical protein